MLSRTFTKHLQAQRYFSTHIRVAIVGGGTAGMTTSAQLAKSEHFKPKDITVFEPRDEHHYQPSYTMIGGGVLGTNKIETKKKEHSHIKRPMKEMFKTGVNLVKEKVETFDPENSKFTTNKNEYTYDYLLVTPGIVLRYDMIDGAQEALDDPDHPVVSVYKEDYAYKTLRIREQFKKGKAIFYQPPDPIKCGGAPKKIMFLSEAEWKQKGLRDKINIHYYSALHMMFPHCKKYSVVVDKLAKKRNITAHLNHTLKAIDKNAKVALFNDTENGREVPVNYDFLHIAPPQSSPEFLAKSPLVNSDGFCEADPKTTQHPRFSNIFSVGDASSLPTSKTAAAVFSEVPVMVHNINQLEGKRKLTAEYDGYTSCPVLIGHKRVCLAEFKYDGVPAETFTRLQVIPNGFFYHMKRDMFPKAYFHYAPEGKWYGKRAIFPPKFEK